MRIYYHLNEIPPLERPSAVAIGVFDGLHIGHHKVIEEAVNYGLEHNMMSVVFTFEISDGSHPEAKIPNNQISSKSIFYDKLESLGVETVVSLSFESLKNYPPKTFVEDILKEKLNAAFISCGQDFRFGKNAAGNWQDLVVFGTKHDFLAVAVPLVEYQGEVVSSTEIRKLITQGDIHHVNTLLGHRYSIDFQVVSGNRIGRTLGTPTINQPYPKGFVQPLHGVYASVTKVDDIWYTSVTNVGTKPTIGDYETLAETYIQGFQGDLYGKHILVEFVSFLRKETKFDNIDLLRNQIHEDSLKAKEFGSIILEKL